MDGVRWEPGSPTALSADHPSAIVVDSYAMSDSDGADLAAVAPLAQFDDHGDDVAGALAIGPVSAEVDEPGRVAGPRFACLRRAFWGAPARDAGRPLRRILVTTGGGDPTASAVTYVTSVRAALPHDVDVIWSRPDDDHPAPAEVQPIAAQPSLIDTMLACDLVVCGAGVTMLEAASLGLPCIAIVLAENQRPGRDRLAAEGAIVPAEDADGVAEALVQLAGAADERRALAHRARALVDGFGAFRVAARVEALGSEEPGTVATLGAWRRASTGVLDDGT
jgi:spore coat polysaccharide biosynthesis predicted glycosyltransferase SpsG